VKIGWRTYPHRCLLILDDFHAHPLLKKKDGELSRMLKKLRHFNINIIIAVQTTKSLTKDLKRTFTDCVLFPGIPEEDFKYLIKETPLGIKSANEMWSDYQKISIPHTMYTIHGIARKIVITYPQ
jgi:hypothetical protein